LFTFIFNFRGKFNPYLKKSFDIALQALNYPSEEIKIAALAALVQICINWYKIQTIEAHTGKHFNRTNFIIDQTLNLCQCQSYEMKGLICLYLKETLELPKINNETCSN
jgi:hypothetical protein